MADIYAASMASLKRVQVGTTIEQFDNNKVNNHWRRNRKATVDLLELPVAVDRQLEDQRIQQEYNRNPRVHIPTKVDKVRSETIVAKKGNSRDVGIKAKVVNKIVREASGMPTYAIVPPPRLKGEVVPLDKDPETNPLVKAYAKETKKKPHMASYGHRPGSASRVFNPGTMKIRMRHNEFARAPKEGMFEFGLPVGILGKLLHAPKIVMAVPTDEEDGGAADSHRADPHGLFSDLPASPNPNSAAFAKSKSGGFESKAADTLRTEYQPSGYQPTGPQDMSSFAAGSPENTWAVGMNESQASQQLGQNESWISGDGDAKDSVLFDGGVGNIDYLDIRVPGFPVGGSVEKKKKKKGRANTQLTPLKVKKEVPAWNTAHNVISPLTRQKEIYALKANHMNDQQLNLQERLVRYNAKALADEKTPFCSEKQVVDIELLRGRKPDDVRKLSTPVKGMPSFYDPLNSQLQHVKDRRKEIEEDTESKWKAKDFQDSIAEIPKVAYHPATLLTQMQNGGVSLKQIGRLAKAKPDLWKEEDFYSPEKGESVDSQVTPSRRVPENSVSMAATSPQYDTVGNVLPEAALQLAMLKAKSGDTRSLYNLFMAQDPSYRPAVSGQLIQDGSLADSDFHFLDINGMDQEQIREGMAMLEHAAAIEQGLVPLPDHQQQEEKQMESADALEPARSASPPRSAAGSPPKSASGSRPGTTGTAPISPPKSASGSRPGTTGIAPTSALLSAAQSAAGSPPKSAGGSRPVTADAAALSQSPLEVNTDVFAKLPSSAPLAVDLTLEIDDAPAEQPADAVAPEISSDFFGGKIDFQELTLDQVPDDSSIDQEQSRHIVSAPLKTLSEKK